MSEIQIGRWRLHCGFLSIEEGTVFWGTNTTLSPQDWRDLRDLCDRALSGVEEKPKEILDRLLVEGQELGLDKDADLARRVKALEQEVASEKQRLNGFCYRTTYSDEIQTRLGALEEGHGSRLKALEQSSSSRVYCDRDFKAMDKEPARLTEENARIETTLGLVVAVNRAERAYTKDPTDASWDAMQEARDALLAYADAEKGPRRG